MKTRGVPDFLLLFLTALLIGFGITMVISSSSIFAYAGQFTMHGCQYCGGDELYFVKKQITWVGLGIVAMLVAMNIPFSFYKKNFLLISLISFALLVVVLLPWLDTEANGARSWLKLGPASLQTSEFAKLGLIIYLAAIIAKKGERFRQFKTGLIPPLVMTGAFFLLIAQQPDLGTAAILLGTAGVMMICGGANLKHLFLLTMPPFTLFFLSYLTLNPHALTRIQSFLDPWSSRLGTGWQLSQSYYALARGGISGTGFGQGIQKYLYLPEAHTDFIFAVIGEELGFIGTTLFLLIYLSFLLRGLFICLKSKDTFASLTGIGIVTMIGLQALVNIGGATGSIPITGVPLPFISYGGSSLLVCMIGTGILLSVSREVNRQKTMELLQAKKT
ncbi:putative lipid II flippase FtsW [Brevibacillus humidisoli]|uniref:putative lipid II flippase FtsW n=1 Tax=Brevibacillus humidisoli TaxID=2895522 RepID=UPI001E3EACD0|nr:putative lipid II flippase FtsW [Brevibacillus humidisoli]UFJ42962.1 putative lipid II flippase FtsW [Brevibacillus humidisoli]